MNDAAPGAPTLASAPASADVNGAEANEADANVADASVGAPRGAASRDPDGDGSMVLVLFGLLLIAVALVVTRVGPSGERLRKTLAAEAQLRKQVDEAKSEQARLKLVDDGLESDRAVIERELREKGLANPGEIRIESSESKPR